ncbi:hypothetical protein [Ectothiorhodospira variabilis]|uniref:hypothetical protein n=1 Tax=Ectothiorhodospira variabilis TaxID=505694 RepID=UPI001EFAE0D6|nr:hypothetical protein [Ectothiorhodospira variabilis]MCG5496022.1 hypothetical protein [Ectothiorhodospira variabilis]MCG5505310.1 hypothetical protein [Ectothiorhodospira variabilis]MCG5508481.1 hypothetical protein [Ectothiorhodospira variabilis]
MTTLTIDLPDSLAKEAKDAGLLDPHAIEAMLRENLRRQLIDDLFTAADKLAAAKFPSMTMEEIQQEVNEVRRGRNVRLVLDTNIPGRESRFSMPPAP